MILRQCCLHKHENDITAANDYMLVLTPSFATSTDASSIVARLLEMNDVRMCRSTWFSHLFVKT